MMRKDVERMVDMAREIDPMMDLVCRCFTD